MHESPRYLDLPSLAVFLGLSTRTVNRMVDRGDLPQPERLGRLCRWNEATVDRFLKQRGASATTSFAVPVVYPNDPSKQDAFASRLTVAIEKSVRELLDTIAKGGA